MRAAKAMPHYRATTNRRFLQARTSTLAMLLGMTLWAQCFAQAVDITGDVSADPAPLPPVSSEWDLTNQNLIVGWDGSGSMTIGEGGKVSNIGGTIGEKFGSDGMVVVSGGDAVWKNSDGLVVARFGTGSLTVSDGGKVSSTRLYIASGGQITPTVMLSHGTLNIKDAGSLLEVGGEFVVGGVGVGVLNISEGAQVRASNVESQVGSTGTAEGSVAVTGADSLWENAGQLTLGVKGTGSLSIDDGGLVRARSVHLGNAADASGELLLNGVAGSRGVLEADQLTRGDGSATVIFDGGVLRARRDEADYLSDFDRGAGAVQILAGGAFIDSNGFDLGIQTNLSGGMGSSLTKLGAGVLMLTGDNTIARTTASAGTLRVGDALGTGTLLTNHAQIDGGAELRVDGALIGDSVLVDAGGLLSGGGTVAASTTIAAGGTLAPGNSIGTLTIDGDLTLDAGALFVVEVDPHGGAADRVAVTGHATVSDASVVHIGNNGDYQPLSTYRILTAGSIDGAFGSVNSDYAFLTPELLYVTLPDATRAIDLKLARNDTGFADMGRTRNQVATARGVAGLGQGHRLHDEILGMPSDAALIQRGFDLLSGEVHASVQTAMMNDSLLVRNAANDRLRSAFSGVGMEFAPIRVASAGGLSGLAAVAPPRAGPGFWVQGFGSWSRQDGDGNAATLRHDTAGVFVGADAPAGDWRFGALAGYSHSNFDLMDRTSSGKSDNYHIGLYGGRQWGRLGLRSGLGYTWHALDTRRSVAVGGLSERLKAGYRAHTLQAYGEVGYRVDIDAASLEPYANLAHVRLHTPGYAEQGGVAALSSRAQRTDTTYSTLGLRISRIFALGAARATAHGAMGWRHGMGDVRPRATHAFSGGDSFTVAGTPIARDAAVLEAGLDLRVGDTASLGVSYTGQLASAARDHGVSARLSVAF